MTATVRRLLELMVSDSDNTAADYFVHRLGPKTITSAVHALGG